jgi:hypothetical protein
MNTPASTSRSTRSLQLLQRANTEEELPADSESHRKSLGDWCVEQIERFWQWGESSHHHRLGSWLRH